MSFKKNNLKGSLSSISQVAQQNSANNAGQVIYVHPDECYVVDGENPRTEFDEELIASYVKDFLNPDEGQHEPCSTYPKDEKGYRIQHGATRREAASRTVKINPDFRLKIIPDPKLAKQPAHVSFWQRGKNNIQRDNMTIIDRANFIGRFIDLAKEAGETVSQQEIAEGLNLKGGNTTVSRLLALRNASPEIKEIINTRRTEDIETLVTLVKIQESEPELFKELVEKTELDRATVRRAKKTGSITTAAPVQVPTVTDGANAFAHAQNDASTGEADDDSTVTIAYMDYAFKTGRVDVLIKKVDKGYQGALETYFAHGITCDKALADSPLHRSEDDAVIYAKSLLADWAETVTADKSAVSVEEYQDAKGFLQWSKKGNKPSEKTTGTTGNTKPPVKGVLKATVWGEVNGEKCELLVNVPHELMGADVAGKETSGFIWVSVDGVVKLANEADFVYKSVTYKG